MTEAEAVARGHRAFNDLEEVGAAFDAVRDAILKALAETPVGQEAKVLNLHKSLQNLAAVRKALQNTIDAGRVASASQAARDAIAGAGLTRPS